MESVPFEALSVRWLLYERNWKAFAGLTLVVTLVLAQGLLSFRSTSKLLNKVGLQVQQLQDAFEALPIRREAVGPALLDKDLDVGPLLARMEGLQGQIEAVSQQVQKLQSEIRLDKALEDLQTLVQAVEATKGLIKEMEDPTQKSTERIQQLQEGFTETAERLKQFHETFTRSHLASTMKMLASKAEAEDLEKLTKLVQSELLKMMQQFAAAETVMDSILKQGRESHPARHQECHGESSGLGEWNGTEPQLTQDLVE